mgnify:FL=1
MLCAGSVGRSSCSQNGKGEQKTDLNRAETGTVTGGHVLVAGVDGVGTRELTVLLVHVVSSRARVVAEPDAKVLDLERLLLADLQAGGCPVNTRSEPRVSCSPRRPGPPPCPGARSERIAGGALPDSPFPPLFRLARTAHGTATEISSPSPTPTLPSCTTSTRQPRLTTLTATTSPVAFLTLRSLRRKYQKRDLATTSFGAKMRIR